MNLRDEQAAMRERQKAAAKGEPRKPQQKKTAGGKTAVEVPDGDEQR